uniref:Putative nuclease n=1 Tax=viral metagenome TaxID=1070528 RepID=A0A6M3JAL8_9ZZZZ
MDELVVVVDDREKLPWTFAGVPGVTTRPGRLRAGDYSVEGLEGRVALERKSLKDLVRTISVTRDRFFGELRLLAGYRYAAIVVEGSVEDVLSGRYDSDASPESVLGSVAAIEVGWRVPVVWAGPRPVAQAYAALLLRRAARTTGEAANRPPSPQKRRQWNND